MLTLVVAFSAALCAQVIQAESRVDGVEARIAADRHWRPILERWKTQLNDQDEGRRAEATEALDGVSDPMALPAVLRVFTIGGAGDQAWAGRILGHLDTPVAARALAMLAIVGGSEKVRRTALRTLRARDPGVYADVLISGLRETFRYMPRSLDGHGDSFVLFVDDKPFDRRQFREASAPTFAPAPGDKVGTDGRGILVIYRFRGRPNADRPGECDPRANLPGTRLDLDDPLWNPSWQPVYRDTPKLTGDPPADAPRVETMARRIGDKIASVLEIAEYRPEGRGVSKQLRADIAVLDAINATIESRNAWLADALQEATGQRFGNDPEAWRLWWVDRGGGHSGPRPTSAASALVRVASSAGQPMPEVASPALTIGLDAQPDSRVEARPGGPGRISRMETFRRPLGRLEATIATSPLFDDWQLKPFRFDDRVVVRDTATGRLDFAPPFHPAD